jgi:ribosome biogenesis GTPase A
MFCSFSSAAERREAVTTSTTGMKKKKRVVPPCTATVTELQQQKKKAQLKQKEKKMDSNKAKGLGSSASSALKLSDSVCPGCGVTMQDKNPNAPGFFIIPRRMSEEVEEVEEKEEEEEEEEEAAEEGSEVRSLHGSGEYEDEDEDDEDEIGLLENEGIDYDYDDEEDEGEGFEEEGIEGSKESKKKKKKSGWTWITVDPNDKALAELDGEINGEEELDEAEIERELMREEEWMKGLDGFAPASSDFGSGGALTLNPKKQDRDRISKGERDKNDELDKKRLVVCARCHELRHYGKVKDESKENLLPDFDFEATVGARLVRTHATRTVVVMVVDSVDFDGSFPRRVSALLAELEEKEASSWRENRPGNVPRLILVANKIDLLPRQISPVRLDHWVRRRAKDGGAPKLSGLFLISCVKQWGVKALLECIKEMAGPRGEVWVVGAQNAGKSSLINALAKVSKGSGLTQLTEAAIPGTTLGLVRLGGILPANAKLFDTPGLLHPHQITARLNREELKLVQVRKELRPRTYRVKVLSIISTFPFYFLVVISFRRESKARVKSSGNEAVNDLHTSHELCPIRNCSLCAEQFLFVRGWCIFLLYMIP